MTEDAGHEAHSSAALARRAATAIRTGAQSLVANVPAFLAGVHLGPEAAVAVSALVSGVQEFRSSTREEAREETVLVLAAREIQRRIDVGESVRSDGFFDNAAAGRSAGEEVWESAMVRCQRESSERKLPYIAHLLAGVAFDDTVDLDMAHQMILAAEQLTYRQLCIMRLAKTKETYSLRSDNYRSQSYFAKDLYSVLYECADLDRRALITIVDTAVLGLTDVKPGAMELQALGNDLHRLMRLGDIPDEDVAKVAEPLLAD